MDNPYISRGPVRASKMFFGRKHELNEIAAFLRGNQSVSIMGPRKIGKTSLIFHLMRSEVWPTVGLKEDNLFVYMDCEVLGEGNHEEIYGQFAWEIEAALDERNLPEEPSLQRAINKPSRLSFEGAIRKLNRRGLRIILILDEFERISTNPDLNVNFFNALRSAAGRYQLAFITASARPLIQLTYSNQTQDILSSPFFNIFAPLFLSFLSEEDAKQLIEVPSAKAGVTFNSETSEFLYKLVGGHPLALQVACFYAMENPNDISEIEQRTLREMNAHFEYYWQNLSLSEQETVRRLSKANTQAASDTTMRGLLRDLVQKCILVADRGTYRHPSLGWKKFVSSQNSPPTTILRTGGELTGSYLGQYEVLERIGRGGMSEVYKGRHPRLERTVAIKILPANIAAEADFRQRFEREAQAVATLRHPNIVQVYDFGDIDGLYYMVIEYIEGHDLIRYMREKGAIPIETALPLIKDIAASLDYAHTQGLIHRDVKPSNVMLQPITQADGVALRAILTDFGIAKIRTGNGADTQTGMLMGTLDYMAPEQINANSEIDGRADIYALGVMIYHMLVGEVPFKGDNPGTILMAHLHDPIPNPRDRLPELPENIATTIKKAMAKDPNERFFTARELIKALESR